MTESPSDICGTTFSTKGVPVFICTLPPHAGRVHENSSGKAWMLVGGKWTVQWGWTVQRSGSGDA